MKKFSEIGSNFENKKYTEKSKNEVHSMITENIVIGLNLLNENVSSNLDNVNTTLEGTNKLVEQIDEYVKREILKERVKVLQSVKSAIATGTLSLQRINEEIEACDCSETCPDVSKLPNDSKKKIEVEEFDDDDDNYYDDDLDIVEDDTEYITTNESASDDTNLVDKFIEKADSGQAEKINWDDFFDEFDVSLEARSDYVIREIIRQVNEKRPDIFFGNSPV